MSRLDFSLPGVLVRTCVAALAALVLLVFAFEPAAMARKGGKKNEDPLEGIDIYGGEGDTFDMPDVTKPERKKKKSAGTGLAVLPGYAFVMRGGTAGKLLGNGHEMGVYVRYTITRRNRLAFAGGLAARYATFAKELAAPAGGTTASKASGTSIDSSLPGEILYRLSDGLQLFAGLGPALVHHNLVILNEDAEIADDYHADYGFGYVLQPGLEYALNVGSLKPLFRFYLRLAGGREIKTGKLKYNHEEVDINELQFAAGLDVGVAI